MVVTVYGYVAKIDDMKSKKNLAIKKILPSFGLCLLVWFFFNVKNSRFSVL